MMDDERKRREICDERVRDGLAMLNRAGELAGHLDSAELRQGYLLNTVRALLDTVDHMLGVQQALELAHPELTPEKRIHLLNAAIGVVFGLQDFNLEDLQPVGKPS